MNPYRPCPPPARRDVKGELARVRSEAMAHAAFAMTTCSVGLILMACSGAQTQVATGPSVDLAACVIGSVAADVAAGKTWTVCVEDAVTNCGADAASVVKVWTAHEAAMVKEGVTPPVIKGRTP